MTDTAKIDLRPTEQSTSISVTAGETEKTTYRSESAEHDWL